MNYQSELSFLRDVFEKSRVNTELLSIKGAEDFFDKKNGKEGSLRALFENIRPMTVYKLKDNLGCRYRLFLLPQTEKLLTVGPYLCENIGEDRILQIAEQRRFSQCECKYLREYYSSMPELTDGSPLLIMLSSFCERIWNTPSFAVREIDGEDCFQQAPLSNSMPETEGQSDPLINLRAMERRYAFENEMIRAVELGLVQSEFSFGKVPTGDLFEKRVDDPLRNAKNYGIIMNTLLRKAAERGGVHPIHLDRVSSDFAVRLEKSASVSENTSLMLEMFRSYCRLVRKHRLSGYSLVVQKIILSIDADLSQNLSSGTLAKKQGISLGYLSSVFRKETGMTVSEYIRERRMEYARYLLGSTKLQIQTVAFNSGIMDVQYFSKLFKKRFGQTPSEYRNSTLK